MSLRSRIVDGVFGTLELFAATYDLARKLQRRVRRDTDPIPLTPERRTDTFRDVDSGRYTSRLADAKPPANLIPKAPRVPKI